MRMIAGALVQAGTVVSVWTESADSKNAVWRGMIKDGIIHLPEDNETLKNEYDRLHSLEEVSDDELHQFIAMVEDAEGYDISLWDITNDAVDFLKSALSDIYPED